MESMYSFLLLDQKNKNINPLSEISWFSSVFHRDLFFCLIDFLSSSKSEVARLLHVNKKWYFSLKTCWQWKNQISAHAFMTKIMKLIFTPKLLHWSCDLKERSLFSGAAFTSSAVAMFQYFAPFLYGTHIFVDMPRLKKNISIDISSPQYKLTHNHPGNRLRFFHDSLFYINGGKHNLFSVNVETGKLIEQKYLTPEHCNHLLIKDIIVSNAQENFLVIRESDPFKVCYTHLQNAQTGQIIWDCSSEVYEFHRGHRYMNNHHHVMFQSIQAERDHSLFSLHDMRIAPTKQPPIQWKLCGQQHFTSTILSEHELLWFDSSPSLLPSEQGNVKWCIIDQRNPNIISVIEPPWPIAEDPHLNIIRTHHIYPYKQRLCIFFENNGIHWNTLDCNTLRSNSYLVRNNNPDTSYRYYKNEMNKKQRMDFVSNAQPLLSGCRIEDWDTNTWVFQSYQDNFICLKIADWRTMYYYDLNELDFL